MREVSLFEGSSAVRSAGPLAGYRVLDCCGELGAFCTRLLAELRAEVIKVEPPQGDPMRFEGPFVGDEIGIERSIPFLHYHPGKLSITLNLNTMTGQALFHQLVEGADVLVESFPAGYLEERGLGRAVLSQLNPRLVQASITPFGLTGLRTAWQATDLTLMAISGLMQMCGDPAREPLRIGGNQSCHITGAYAAVAIAIALYGRERDGEGQFVEIAAQEAMAPIFEESGRLQAWPLTGILPKRHGLGRDLAFPYGVFACRHGFVAITAATSGQWVALAEWIYEVTGSDLVRDPMFHGTHFDRGPYTDILGPILEDFAQCFDRQTLFHEAQRRGVPLFPVNEIPDLLAEPQFRDRGIFMTLKHPAVGAVTDIGSALRFSVASTGLSATAPLLGADNERVCCGELGLNLGELAALRSTGVI